MRSKLFGFLAVLSLTTTFVAAEDVPPPINPNVQHVLSVPAGGLVEFLKRPNNPVPMVSYHRGGPAPGFPENSIEAMRNALSYGYGLMEIDVAQLKDGTLILMHDDTLSRTTTGEGAVRQQTWDDVKDLYLKDNDGKVTSYRIPRLRDVLLWAKGRTIVTLDFKRGVDFAKVAAMVEETGAQDYTAGISYTLDQAITYNRLAPNMPLSIGMSSDDDIAAFDASGIPSDLVLAWTGTRLRDPAFYKKLHARGWRVLVGTLGWRPTSIDNQIKAGTSDVSYRDIMEMGADVIATDRFWAVQKEISSPNLFVFSLQRLAK